MTDPNDQQEDAPIIELDSLHELGQSPSDAPITDGSINHDKYLYDFGDPTEG
jgi:hypothetical protein